MSQTVERPAARGNRVKRLVVGRAMASGELDETLLSKSLALPIFASDPLSSVAYATEAALVVLLAASASSAHFVLPVSIGIAALLAIVVLSYRQTVLTYESSGGAYVVARENLGRLPSLVAGAALLTDYVLTVAVSVAAGVLALTSAATGLQGHELGLSLACVAVIAVANLRGVREAGLLFAFPTYAFVMSIFLVIGVGFTRCATGSCPTAVTTHPMSAGTGGVTLFLLLRAFASGSTALTGVEAIANGVNAFRRPHGRNAATTLAVLGTIAVIMFLGVSWLAVKMHAHPNVGGSPSVLSEIARGVFPAGSWSGFLFWVVQILTLGVLVLAANTSYQGFPRLAALLARDRFFPRQFTNLGDRLVFSNGIVVLTVIACLLLWVYNASVDSLIHLYVIGVFTAFTISQTGMVRLWFRTRVPRWRRRALLNATGAATTGMVTLIVIWTKFAEGAWLVTVAIPLLVAAFYGVNRHYRRFARRLKAGTAAVQAAGEPSNDVMLWVESNRRRDRECALVHAADRGAQRLGRVCAGAAHRPRHPAALVRPDRREAGSGGAADGRRALARGPRAALADAEGRGSFRDRGRTGRVQTPVALGRGQSHLVSPEAQAAHGAWRRRRRCPTRRRCGGAGADAARLPGARRECPRGLASRGQLRAQPPHRRCARRVVRVRRRRGTRTDPGVGAPGSTTAARPQRRSVSRHRHADPRLPPGADGRSGCRRERRHAGDRRAWLAALAPQPARPLHQASAPLRAPGDPDERSVPTVLDLGR
ncbi:MAG: APC family permease [Actinobacteria bacterium]|nr:APC family permease [Actinomycetota bacterium]